MDTNKILNKEDVDFLKNLANEIKTQNNHCTRKPILFQIAEPTLRYGIDENWEEPDKFEICIGAYDYENFIDIEDLFDIKKKLVEYVADNCLDDELIDEINEIDYDWELYSFLDINDIKYEKRTSVTEIKYSGVFLTEKAAKEHLESNIYHYDKEGKPYTYCISAAWRNPEFQKLFDIIEKFGSDIVV